jgi:hypothetical protein
MRSRISEQNVVLKNGRGGKGRNANPVPCISYTTEWPTIRKVKAKEQLLEEKIKNEK